MPFTPLHMGPGLILKSLMQSAFSLMVFGWCQILMDVQPLLVMITGEGHLHGFSHTFVGATLIATAAAVSGKYLGQFGLKVLAIDPDGRAKISWWTAALSAAIGAYSHVLLDAVMHWDVEPFYPFSEDNPWLHIISVDQLQWFCLATAVLGAALYFLIGRKRHSAGRPSTWR